MRSRSFIELCIFRQTSDENIVEHWVCVFEFYLYKWLQRPLWSNGLHPVFMVSPSQNRDSLLRKYTFLYCHIFVVHRRVVISDFQCFTYLLWDHSNVCNVLYDVYNMHLCYGRDVMKSIPVLLKAEWKQEIRWFSTAR